MLNEGAVVKSTNALAVAGLITPVWLPWLRDVSDMAALWTPILGAIWLITQIIKAWGRK